MSVLFTFPGQGAQRSGMLQRLPDSDEIRLTLEEAADVLGRDLATLDTAEALHATEAAQLCLLIAGVAAARLLIARGASPAMVCGLSVGAFPAAVVAGALSYAEALHLVALRGQLMEQAYPHGYGMTAIVGLAPTVLEVLLAGLREQGQPVYLANINSENQLVIAGSDAAMASASALARVHGARHSERLRVAVPSHCALLADASATFAAAFDNVVIAHPRLVYLSGNLARALFQPERIAADLAGNMASPVHWHDSMRLAWERGARLAVEMPPGGTLTRLGAGVFAGGSGLAFDDTRLDTLAALISPINAQ